MAPDKRTHKRIAVAFAGGLVAEGVNRLVPIAIMVFVAYRIGVEGFGFAQFGIQLMDLGIFFTIFGFHTIASVQIGADVHDNDKIRVVVSETTLLKLGLALLAGAFLIAIAALVPSYRMYLPIISVLSFILLTTAIDQNYVHVGTQRMLSMSVFTVVGKLSSLVAVLVLVGGPDDAILYAALVLAGNGFVGLATCLWNNQQYPFTVVTWRGLRQRMRNALPFAVTAWLIMILDRYDLIVVEYFGGPKAAGLYAAPSRIYFSIVNVLNALGGIFFAEMVALSDRESLTKIVELSFKAMLILVVPLACGVWVVNEQLIGLLVGEAFVGGAPVFCFLLLAAVAHAGIVVFGIQVMQVKGRGVWLNYVLLLALLVGASTSIALYQYRGLFGVAQGLLCAKILAAFILAWSCRQSLSRMPLQAIFQVGTPGLLMLGVLLFADIQNFWANISLGAAVYMLGLTVMNYSDFTRLLNLVRSKI